MIFLRQLGFGLGLLAAIPLFLHAQAPQDLTLQQALGIAVKNHPQIQQALFTALAANQVTLQQRAAYFPTMFASITGAGAFTNSRIAAGSLNNPIIYDRGAAGVTVSQLVTDFGRTGNLVASASLRAQAEQQNAETVKAQIMVQVARAYFNALRTRAVLTVARRTVEARQLVSDQVAALAQSKLKSSLDVSFANVDLAQAKLLVVSAENEVQAADAELAQSLGYSARQNFRLAEESVPDVPPADAGPLIAEAVQKRPELAALRLNDEAAQRFAKAERALSYPSVGLLATAGGIPARQAQLADHWGAVGLNINIPIFNGYEFTARRQEAELRQRAIDQGLRDMQIRIARDVEVAWLNSKTAFERLGLTAQLLQETNQALDLASTRYKLGLGSIVELSQAQLNQASAQIASASARYEYQLQRAVLDYQMGSLR